MSQETSRVIQSRDQISYEQVCLILSRYSLDYQRPIASFSRECFEVIKQWVQNDEFILDLGCGTGQSSYFLANKFQLKVVGVDRSVNRLSRQNGFKLEDPNVLLIQAQILDIVPLIYNGLRDQLHSTHLYYPNPYPKVSDRKKRLHLNPVAPFLFGLSSRICVRSNWKSLIDQLSFAYEYYYQKKVPTQKVGTLDYYLSAFEKKYHLSEHELFEFSSF